MIRYVAIASITLCFGPICADELRQGYVLKRDEGEIVFGGTRIKASPELGTRDIEVLVWPAPAGFSTGLHYHVEADEYFSLFQAVV